MMNDGDDDEEEMMISKESTNYRKFLEIETVFCTRHGILVERQKPPENDLSVLLVGCIRAGEQVPRLPKLFCIHFASPLAIHATPQRKEFRLLL